MAVGEEVIAFAGSEAGMTNDEILEMAKQQGFVLPDNRHIYFARLVAKRQKQIDAEICEEEQMEALAEGEYDWARAASRCEYLILAQED